MGIFLIILIASAIIILIFMIKKLKPSQVIFCILSGMAGLFACDLLLSLFGGNMPINIYTVAISSLGGIPGVILLTLIKTFLA